MRVRGLKPEVMMTAGAVTVSHPMRVRGLKPPHPCCKSPACWVAPHAGAWIETSANSSLAALLASHPMRVRGLKHYGDFAYEMLGQVAPHAGAWIET